MSFFEWVKVFELKPRYLLAVWLFGALLLLSPAYVSERFGFASIVTHYRGWIGLGTLAFFVLWVVQLTAILKDKKEKKARSKEEQIQAQERRTEILKTVNTLSKNESFILLYSLHQNQQTVFAALSNRYVQAMCAKGLLKTSPQREYRSLSLHDPTLCLGLLKGKRTSSL